MTPERLLQTAIVPALSELSARGIRDTIEARRILVAIALQESRIAHRRQLTQDGREAGPAMSYWQFERAGGCRGVLTHPLSAKRMREICGAYDIEPTEGGLWEAMRYHDIVAAAAARLLLYTLPDKLPSNIDSGWAQYLSAWRPGKPHPQTWAAHWETADTLTRETSPWRRA